MKHNSLIKKEENFLYEQNKVSLVLENVWDIWNIESSA